MGIFRRKKFSLLVPILAFSFLTGCEGFKRKPIDINTVEDALEVVNDTLEYLNLDNGDYQTNFGVGYTDIYDQFTSQDYVGNYPRDFNYNDEPFIQFKYAKGVLEQNIADFSFGTKYYDTQNKTVYFDFLTGEKDSSKSAANKVVCDSIIGLDIKVNSFNQINSNIVFQNTYTLSSNGFSFTTNRYVNFTLDYDFSAESPTYLLKLFTRNDELNAPYIGYMTYQYDHIRVKNGALVEYRKFNVETSEAIQFDQYHTSFQNYIDEKIAYRVDSPKWYVDGSYYVSKYMNENKQIAIGSSLYNLGMFEPLSYASFLANLDDNKSINTTTIYSNISASFGDDIQYAFLTKNPSQVSYINGYNNPHYDPDSMYPDLVDELRACLPDGSSIPTYSPSENTQLKALFSSFSDASLGLNIYVPLYYFGRGTMIEEVPTGSTGLSNLFEYYISIDLLSGSETAPLLITNSYTLKKAYQMVDDKYFLDPNDIAQTFTIKVHEKVKNLECSVKFIYGGSFDFLKKNDTFPVELINYGVPRYTDVNVLDYQLEGSEKYENGYGCVITRTSSEEINNYYDELTNKGFSVYASNESVDIFYKKLNSKSILYIKMSRYSEKRGGYTCYYLRTYQGKCSTKSNLTSSFPYAFRQLGIPVYEGGYAMFDMQSDVLYIYDSTFDELNYYISVLRTSYGYVVTKDNRNDGYVVLTENNTTSKTINEITFYYYGREHKDFYVYYETLENPNYVVTLDIAYMYMTSYFDGWNSAYANNSLRLSTEYVYEGTCFYTSSAVLCMKDKEFKFIANGDWNIKNPDSSYSGFGYDDVSNIGDYSYYFYRGSDGRIVFRQTCLLSVNITVLHTYLVIVFNVTSVGTF